MMLNATPLLAGTTAKVYGYSVGVTDADALDVNGSATVSLWGLSIFNYDED
jgi:hypothetical protein